MPLEYDLALVLDQSTTNFDFLRTVMTDSTTKDPFLELNVDNIYLKNNIQLISR